MPTAADTVATHLPRELQLQLAQEVRNVVRRSPLVRPRTPGGRNMRVLVSAAGKLGWVGDGAYHYSPVDASKMPWPRMPATWSRIATEVAGDHPWDSAIINWYPLDAGLGWHQDISEVDTSRPIVTISLGDSAQWAIRRNPGAPTTRCQLDSGDVTLLKGLSRLYEHTIERIIPNPLFSPLRKPGRLSITVRVAGEPCLKPSQS